MCKRMRGAFNQIALAKHCGEAPRKCISQIYFCMKAQFCFIFLKKESTVFVLDVDGVKQLEKQ